MKKEYFAERGPSPGTFVDVGTLSLYFEEYGQGSPLVLLHGYGASGKNWYPFLDALSERHRLIVVDLPGHGHSGHPEGRFTHRNAAASVFLLLDHLGIDRFSAMGMSSGGMTLVHMATTQPHRIRAQVLVSATSSFPDQARHIMRRVSVATMPQDVRRMYDACATRGAEQVLRLTKDFNALADDHDDMNFTPATLGTIRARTLVVHGDRDAFFPVEIPVLLYRSIPQSSLWIVPSGDHVPIFTMVKEFCEKSLGFLETGGADRPGA